MKLMKVRPRARVVAAVLGIISGACAGGSGTPSGTGGTGSTGTGAGCGTSAGGTGGGSSCSNASACGGSVLGTWTVTSSCLTLSSTDLDITYAGLDPRTCDKVTLSGSLTVSGTWT